MIRRICFWLGLSLSLLLIITVAVLPWWPAAARHSRLAALFAHDDVVRRTAIACAIGLFVAAWAFFRPSHDRHVAAAKTTKAIPRSRSRKMIGA